MFWRRLCCTPTFWLQSDQSLSFSRFRVETCLEVHDALLRWRLIVCCILLIFFVCGVFFYIQVLFGVGWSWCALLVLSLYFYFYYLFIFIPQRLYQAGIIAEGDHILKKIPFHICDTTLSLGRELGYSFLGGLNNKWTLSPLRFAGSSRILWMWSLRC